jgi:hypothetical protein
VNRGAPRRSTAQVVESYLVPVVALVTLSVAGGFALARETKPELQRDLRDEQIVGDWIYDDIDAGFARAAKDKRPLCIVFR